MSATQEKVLSFTGFETKILSIIYAVIKAENTSDTNI